MGAHEITQLIHEYGLIVVFVAAGVQAVGFPVPGGTVLAAAAIDASTKRGLPVVGVLAAGALGALAGTTIGFALGRWQGQAFLMRAGRWLRQEPERIQELCGRFRNRAVVPVFIARFVTAARNVAGIVAGAGGMPLRRFLVVSAAAAIAWSALTTLEYYFAGRAILSAPTWLQVVLFIAGVAATVASFRLLRWGVRRPAKAAASAAEVAD